MKNIQQDLRSLERRDWWLWWTALAVMLLLTFAIVSLSLPSGLRLSGPQFLFNLGKSVRGLVGLVLLFDFYAIYQQMLIKNLRREIVTQSQATAKMAVAAKEFQYLSIVDPLTGLYNRRHVEERLLAEVARSCRHGYPLAALILDLDDFKQVNDSNGHTAGDSVLKHFSALLKNAVRPSDVVARIGGDEFVVLLPECALGQVGAVLARLGPLEAQYADAKIPYTFSAGWADMQAGEKPGSLLERADRELYAHKHARKAGQPQHAAGP